MLHTNSLHKEKTCTIQPWLIVLDQMVVDGGEPREYSGECSNKLIFQTHLNFEMIRARYPWQTTGT